MFFLYLVILGGEAGSHGILVQPRVDLAPEAVVAEALASHPQASLYKKASSVSL